jgi:SAM-dependent methyltransferase
MNSYLKICDELIETRKTFTVNFHPYFPNSNERCIETPWVVSHCHKKERVLEVGISLADQTYLDGIIKLLDSHNIKEFHTLDIVPVERTASRFTKEVQNIIFNRFINTIGDARKTPYQDCFFDQIFCISTLEHIGHDEYEEDRAKDTVFKRDSKEPINRASILKNFTADIEVIHEFRRILKQSGELLLSVPMGKGGICTVRDSKGLIAIQTEYDVERWNMLLSQSALKVVETRFFKHSVEKGWFEVNSGNELKDVTCDKLPMAKGVALAQLIKT